MPMTQQGRPGSIDGLSPDDDRAADRVVRWLGRARRILVITGAGMSADSGLPTYRGRDGLYQAHRTTPPGLAIEEALSGEMLASRPEVTWHYLMELERSTRGATPNRGHRVIAEMESYLDLVCILTQNVDALHQAAGSRHVIDIHGDLRELRCTACDHAGRVPDYADLSPPPRCPGCGGVLRPSVVLFGEDLPGPKLDRLSREFEAGFDLIFSIGTSSLFDYIAAPVRLGRLKGIPTVEINPETTAVSSEVEVKIHGRAAHVLDLIWERYLTWWPWA